MDYIHVKNLEKYHPGYKDRNLIWCKAYFTMLNADPDFEMLEEIDKWRLMAFIMLELQLKKSIPSNEQYLTRKGFNLKKRPISLTLKMLHNFVVLVTEDSTLRVVEKRREDIDKEKNKSIYMAFEEAICNTWNSFVVRFPILTKIIEISEKRRGHLKKRFESKHFRDNILQAIEKIAESEFLRGRNDREWKVTFDWLISNDNNYLKILEGRYKDKARRGITQFLEDKK